VVSAKAGMQTPAISAAAAPNFQSCIFPNSRDFGVPPALWRSYGSKARKKTAKSYAALRYGLAVAAFAKKMPPSKRRRHQCRGLIPLYIFCPLRRGGPKGRAPVPAYSPITC
jgi:hypothetical protein